MVEFVNEQNIKKQKSEELEKKLAKEKQKLDDELRQNEVAMQHMLTEIDKNVDMLESIREYKDFMLELTPFEQRSKLLTKQVDDRERFKQDWVEKVKLSDQFDNIIFDEGEILGENTKQIAHALLIPAVDLSKNRHLDSQRG